MRYSPVKLCHGLFLTFMSLALQLTSFKKNYKTELLSTSGNLGHGLGFMLAPLTVMPAPYGSSIILLALMFHRNIMLCMMNTSLLLIHPQMLIQMPTWPNCISHQQNGSIKIPTLNILTYLSPSGTHQTIYIAPGNATIKRHPLLTYEGALL
jgi:hypothetical protein